MTQPPPRSTLFPYTTLFRSQGAAEAGATAQLRSRRRAPAVVRRDDARQVVAHPHHERGSGGQAEPVPAGGGRSEEHTSELQSRENLVCRLLLEKKKNKYTNE